MDAAEVISDMKFPYSGLALYTILGPVISARENAAYKRGLREGLSGKEEIQKAKISRLIKDFRASNQSDDFLEFLLLGMLSE